MNKQSLDDTKEFAAECEDMLGVEIIQYWPVDKPVPEGWRVVGPLSHHHGQYSLLITPERPDEDWEAL